MADIGSGQRDRFITVQALTESIAGSQFPIESWSDLAQVWAHKEDVSGMERFVANQTSAPFDSRWTLPYSVAWDPELVDVRKTRRLVVKGRVHDIVAAEEVRRKGGVLLTTLAGGLVE